MLRSFLLLWMTFCCIHSWAANIIFVMVRFWVLISFCNWIWHCLIAYLLAHVIELGLTRIIKGWVIGSGCSVDNRLSCLQIWPTLVDRHSHHWVILSPFFLCHRWVASIAASFVVRCCWWWWSSLSIDTKARRPLCPLFRSQLLDIERTKTLGCVQRLPPKLLLLAWNGFASHSFLGTICDFPRGGTWNRGSP